MIVFYMHQPLMRHGMCAMQRHLVTIPSGLPVDDLKLMKKRRAQTIRTMEAMSVLDIARGLEGRRGSWEILLSEVVANISNYSCQEVALMS